jgi:hypothetical protein
MNQRWPVVLAILVSTVTVLASGVAAFLALSYAAEPVALGLGGLGLIAAFLGLFAVIQWVRQAESAYPDYPQQRAPRRADPFFADMALAAANERGAERVALSSAALAPALKPAAMPPRSPLRVVKPPFWGDNVVLFDRRRPRRRPLATGPAA